MDILQAPFRVVSSLSRKRKFERFFAEVGPAAGDRILDLGGEGPHPTQMDRQLLDSYPWKSQVVLVNITRLEAARAAAAVPEISAVCGDGTRLPFPDKSFDICFCNAVIEHLFSWENQRRMAAEIMRVSRRWFVTTPNRWFPFEPHLRLPLVTWLPQEWQHRLGARFSYNHVRRKYMSGHDCRELRLLGRRQLRALFPGSRVVRNGLPGFTPTWMVMGGEGR